MLSRTVRTTRRIIFGSAAIRGNFTAYRCPVSANNSLSLTTRLTHSSSSPPILLSSSPTISFAWLDSSASERWISWLALQPSCRLTCLSALPKPASLLPLYVHPPMHSKKICAIDQPPTGDQSHHCFYDCPANRKPKCAEAEDREQNPERFCLSVQSRFTSLK